MPQGLDLRLVLTSLWIQLSEEVSIASLAPALRFDSTTLSDSYSYQFALDNMVHGLDCDLILNSRILTAVLRYARTRTRTVVSTVKRRHLRATAASTNDAWKSSRSMLCDHGP